MSKKKWGSLSDLARMAGKKPNTISGWRNDPRYRCQDLFVGKYHRPAELKSSIKKSIKDEYRIHDIWDQIQARQSLKHVQSVNIRHGKSDTPQGSTSDEIKKYLEKTIDELATLPFAELQRYNEFEKLLMAQVKRKTIEGTLIDVDMVLDEVRTAFRILRDAVFTLPHRETALLMSIHDAKKFERKFAEILKQPFEDLQKFKYYYKNKEL